MQNLFALSVDNLTLLVHNIVILQDVLTNAEVACFNLLLRVLDGLGYEAVLNRLIILHTQLVHNAGNIIATEQTHQIVLQAQEEFGRTRIALTSAAATQLVINTTAFMTLRTDDMQTAKLRHAFAQRNISTTAGHVRCNCYSAILTCQRNNLCFFFMIFCVQHVMRNAATLQHSAELLRLCDRGRTDKHRTAGLMAFLNLIDSSLIFSNTRLINNVRIIHTDHRLIGRYNDNRQVINLLELLLLSLSRTGHASQLIVHTEVVLEGDGSQGLAFAFNLYALLSLDSLMQTFGEAAAKHQTAGELIDDDNLTILNNIIAVTMHQSLRLQSAHNLVGIVNAMLIIIQVADAQHLLCLSNTLFRRCYLLLLFINSVVLALLHVGNNMSKNLIQLGGFFTRAGDNQRGTRFVDQDTIDLIDDTVVQLALNHLVFINHHVITQVVEAEFVVCAVGNISSISSLAVREVHIMHNQANRQAQRFIDTAHVFAVTTGKIVIDSNNMHALARKSVEVYRRSRYKCFALAGTHLGNFAAVQHNAAYHLYVKMTHTGNTLRCLADNSKGLRQNIIQSFALLQTNLKFRSLGR